MKTITVTLFFKQFAIYPFRRVLGAFSAWLKVLSCNFGAILLKKPKNVRDSVPQEKQLEGLGSGIKRKNDMAKT